MSPHRKGSLLTQEHFCRKQVGPRGLGHRFQPTPGQEGPMSNMISLLDLHPTKYVSYRGQA